LASSVSFFLVRERSAVKVCVLMSDTFIRVLKKQGTRVCCKKKICQWQILK
jgi:hypothetical protein